MDPIKNFDEVMANLRRIVERPMHPYTSETVAKLEKEFHEKNKKSLEMFEEAKKYIPGGVEHNLSLNHPFPIAVDKVKGCKVWDVDGKEYIDYLMCGGPIIIGHAVDEIDGPILKLIKEKGPASGVTSEYEILAAREIVKHMPAVDLVRFFASGTEADMAAIRLARVYTDKEKIIKIGGSYHGWSDQLVYSLHIPGTGPLEASGIPRSVNKHTMSIPPNHEKKLRRAFKKAEDKGGVAAVILEPCGGESGTHPVHPEWNKTVREICDDNGALLIFDEVVTGFRMGLGGAQKYFNVMPDLTVLGKIIGQGYPTCGALGGKREVMSTASAGVEGIKKKAYTGGTLSANPILTAACYHTLKYMEKNNSSDRAAAYADKLTKELNSMYDAREDLPFFAYNYRSIIHNETSAFFAIDLNKDKDALNQIMERREVAEQYQLACHLKGIHLLQGSRIYTCQMHELDDALDKTVKAFEYMLSLIPKN